MNFDDFLKNSDPDMVFKAVNDVVNSLFVLAVSSKILTKEERKNIYSICEKTLIAISVDKNIITKCLDDFETNCLNFPKLLNGEYEKNK